MTGVGDIQNEHLAQDPRSRSHGGDMFSKNVEEMCKRGMWDLCIHSKSYNVPGFFQKVILYLLIPNISGIGYFFANIPPRK